MKKIVLIDGNNLMFRSYYATAYSGNILKNKDGFPTNALYGFVSMINKIIEEEKPEYVAVAFDVGINFRKKEFAFYKDGRAKTPEELKIQMPVAREILTAMGIKYLEMEPYEADDIIGSLVHQIALNKEYNATIISSDKDLLQLINFETDIKLLKQTGYIRYNEESFFNDYHIQPVNITDLKGLMGDSSDNIPGVKGIGEKTALKLLEKYHTIENLYDHIEEVKGSVHDKLVSEKENAFISKRIATIYIDVPLGISLDELKYDKANIPELTKLYNKLGFTSFLKKIDNINSNNNNLEYITVNSDINVVLEKDVAMYLECDNEVYTNGSVIGVSVCDNKHNYLFNKDNLYRLNDVLKNHHVFTYDYKKYLYFLKELDSSVEDEMIAMYLSNRNVKDDPAIMAAEDGYNIENLHNLLKNNDQNAIMSSIIQKTRYIYDKKDSIIDSLLKDNVLSIYQDIEMPLIRVLSSMEKTGVIVKKEVLDNQGSEIEKRLNTLTDMIYNYAGATFNIASPKQLGEILFDKMQLGKGKKNKTGYKTDVDTLEKIKDEHPIVSSILEYRALSKLKSTYIEGLTKYIKDDGKIHSIFTQTIARTGRLSSIEPNLQNIPVRDDLGRQIRKAFYPSNDVFLSCDYSQVELRILAHIADCKMMIDTFNNNGDIHTKVAADINGVPLEAVTKEMRSKAKSVIFGIVYGISGYGLGENLHISKSEADYFINKYYELYPEVKKYMDNTIAFAKEKGYVTTMYNRKRFIEELSSTNFMVRNAGERIAINTPIQGSAADIMKMAMIKVYDEFTKRKLKSKLVLQVHDELIIDVCNDELELVKQIVKDTMENIVKLKVPLKVSSDIGDNWYDTK